MKWNRLGLVLMLMLAGASGAATQACSTPAAVAGRSTANLTAPGLSALHKKEVVRTLDVIRDTAIDGESLGVVKTSTTRVVVLWHKSALEVIKASGEGWQSAVVASLDQLRMDVPSAERATFTPYIDAAKVIFQAVIQ